MDPYTRSRYEQGLDSKIVVMGNSGLTRLCSFLRAGHLQRFNPGVGKTSLLQRYTQNKFDPKNMTSTSGAFFVTKKVSVQGLKVRLQLWDTAGQERFRSMVRSLAQVLAHCDLVTDCRPCRHPCTIEVDIAGSAHQFGLLKFVSLRCKCSSLVV